MLAMRDGLHRAAPGCNVKMVNVDASREQMRADRVSGFAGAPPDLRFPVMATASTRVRRAGASRPEAVRELFESDE
jgi:hypothetical protein